MSRKELHKKIKNRKNLLNFLLLFMKRTNPLIVLLSQNLDDFIQQEQLLIYKKQKIKMDNARNSKVA